MINEKILIKTLKKWQGDSSTYAGLKEPALLQKVIDEAQRMVVNEEIKQRIRKADTAEQKHTATDLIEKAKTNSAINFANIPKNVGEI